MAVGSSRLPSLWNTGLGVNVAATILFLYGGFLLYWIHLEKGNDRTRLGLWEICYDCRGVYSCSSLRHINIPAWFRLVQLCVCLAVLIIVLNLVLRLQSAPRKFSVVCIVLDYITAFLGFKAALICGSKRDQTAFEFEDGEATASFHFGFAFDIAGCVLFLVSALLFTVGCLQTQFDRTSERNSVPLSGCSESVRVETSNSEREEEEV